MIHTTAVNLCFYKSDTCSAQLQEYGLQLRAYIDSLSVMSPIYEFFPSYPIYVVYRNMHEVKTYDQCLIFIYNYPEDCIFITLPEFFV